MILSLALINIFIYLLYNLSPWHMMHQLDRHCTFYQIHLQTSMRYVEKLMKIFWYRLKFYCYQTILLYCISCDFFNEHNQIFSCDTPTIFSMSHIHLRNPHEFYPRMLVWILQECYRSSSNTKNIVTIVVATTQRILQHCAHFQEN